MKSACLRLSKWITSLATLAIIVFLLGGCILTNHPPFITSLKAEPQRLPPLGSCRIECVASDEDGDELSYKWFASKGNIDGEGATVTWNAPDLQGIYNIMIKVTDGNGGEVTKYMTITVRVNRPPAITNLITDQDWVTPSSSCKVKCDAEDPDGNELTYKWSASAGDISGTGSVVTWTAPEAVGLHNITVVVIDGQGGEDTALLTISTALDRTPIIEDLIVTPKEPKYMKKYSGGYKILKGKSCKIECISFDPEDVKLTYKWTTDGGSISGEGPEVTWTAPREGSRVTVTVTVSDSSGGAATKSVGFRVETCACAFRGG